jgi:cytochrome c2
MKLLLLVLAALLLAGCKGGRSESRAALLTDGDPRRGAAIIRDTGCGSCHTIPGIRGADGKVGPPLDFFSLRTYIAGRIPNTPENLAGWLRRPQSVDPQTAMPDLGLTQAQANDVVAYLYTLH